MAMAFHGFSSTYSVVALVAIWALSFSSSCHSCALLRALETCGFDSSCALILLLSSPVFQMRLSGGCPCRRCLCHPEQCHYRSVCRPRALGRSGSYPHDTNNNLRWSPFLYPQLGQWLRCRCWWLSLWWLWLY